MIPKTIHEASDGEPVTISHRRETFMQVCCDCQLTHLFKYTVRGGKLTIRAWRDDQTTASLRRRRKRGQR